MLLGYSQRVEMSVFPLGTDISQESQQGFW